MDTKCTKCAEIARYKELIERYEAYTANLEEFSDKCYNVIKRAGL